MYADTITESMQIAIDETKRRRAIQIEYNERNNITPTTIKKAVRDVIRISTTEVRDEMKDDKPIAEMNKDELIKEIEKTQKKMKKAAAELNFEAAVELRDRMLDMKKALLTLE